MEAENFFIRAAERFELLGKHAEAVGLQTLVYVCAVHSTRFKTTIVKSDTFCVFFYM